MDIEKIRNASCIYISSLEYDSFFYEKDEKQRRLDWIKKANKFSQCFSAINKGNRFDYLDWLHKSKMITDQECADAVDNGFVVTYSNQKYKGMNLYEWIKWNVKNRVDVLNDNERDIIEKLTGKSLSNIFQYNKPILVVDIIENRKIGKYDSQSKAAKDIQKIYGYKISATVIGNCVNNIQKSPYKGRFMFYYATDEEIKKYLEESKVS